MRTRIAPANATPTPVFYGGVQPTSLGLEAFRAHDAAKSWDDEGRHRQLLEDGIAAAMEEVKRRLAPAIQKYGSEQVRDGVADYASGCYVEAGVVDNQIHLAIDFSNNEATFRVHVPLLDVIAAAVADAEKKRDPATASMLDELGKFVNELQSLPEPEPIQQRFPSVRAPAGVAAPGRRVR